jgi:hypothetical protein
MTMPEKLRPGDIVALLSASSPLESQNLPLIRRAIALLESWGLRARDPSAPDLAHPYLAGAPRRPPVGVAIGPRKQPGLRLAFVRYRIATGRPAQAST